MCLLNGLTHLKIYGQRTGGQPNEIQLFICNRTCSGPQLITTNVEFIKFGRKNTNTESDFLLRRTGIRQLASMIKFKHLTC